MKTPTIYLWLSWMSLVLANNTPPTILAQRSLNVMENTTIGTRITQIHAEDTDNDELLYSLRPPSIPLSLFRDGSKYFRIDPRTGIVSLKESLQGLGSQRLMVGVAVSDGHITSKMDILVQVIPADGSEFRPTNDRINSPGSGLPPFGSSGIPLPPPLPSQPLFPGLPPRPPDLPSHLIPPSGNINFSHSFSAPPLRPLTGPADSSITPPPSWPQNTPLVDHVPGDNSVESQTVQSIESIHQAPKESQGNVWIIVVPVVVLLIALLLIILGMIYFRRRFCQRKSVPEKSVKAETLKTISTTSSSANDEDQSLSLQHWISKKAISNRYESWHIGELDQSWRNKNQSEDGWEFPRHRLHVISILGEGCFGQVWKCEAADIAGKEGSSFVAVKTLKESAGDRERQDLLKELQVMKTLQPHPNIVTLLGCCTDKDPIFVIMEYVNGGKLQSFLRKSRAEHYYGNLHGSSSHLSSRDLTSFAYQVARAMDYLTTRGIIHRDLAARNVLISDDRICKVADFGFARDVMGNHIYERKSEGRLPIRWMAPESLYDNIFSAKSDVWSFGVLLWEIVTLGSTPYPGMSASEVMRRVREGYRLEKPEHCKREVYNIMFYCWEKDPLQRPSFQELVELLEQLLLSETDYIELERFPDHSYYNMIPPTDEKV